MHRFTGDASSLSDFELAALVCGHDLTETGRADARSDHRVWDLLGSAAVAQHIANARAAITGSKAMQP